MSERDHASEIAGWEYLVRDLQARLRSAEDECRTLRAECEGWRRDEAFRRDYEARRMAALSEAADAAMAAFAARTGEAAR